MAVRRGTPHPVVDDETWPDGARPDRRVHVFVWVGLLLVGLMLSSEAPGQVFRAGIPVPAPSGPPVAPLPTDAPASPTVADDPVPSSLYTQLRDDELTWWAGPQTSSGPFLSQLLLPDGTVTHITQEPLPDTLPQPVGFNDYLPPVEFAAGRIVDPNADQLVAMTKTGHYTRTDECYSFDYTVAVFVNPATSSAPSPPPYQFRPCLAARPLWYASPFALAAGDLDRVADANGELHDEIVLVTETGNAGITPPGVPTITVLDYGAEPGQVTVTQLDLPGTGSPALEAERNRLYYPLAASGLDHTKYGNPRPGQVRVALFDPLGQQGGGAKYIAVVHTGVWDANRGARLSVLQYTPPDPDTPSPASLQLVNVAFLTFAPADVSAPIALAAGDFDGDGQDELAVAYVWSTVAGPPYSFSPAEGAGLVMVYKLSAQHVLAAVTPWPGYPLPVNPQTQGISGDCDPACDPPQGAFVHADLRLVSGLFRFDPQHGQTLTRRQLAVAYLQWDVSHPQEPRPSGLMARVLTVAKGSPWWTVTFGPEFPLTPSVGTPGEYAFDLAAGGYAGVKAPVCQPTEHACPDPTWQLAVGYRTGADLIVDFLKPTGGTLSGGEQLTRLTSVRQPLPGDQYATRLLPFDYDGDALSLGAPVVFYTNTLRQTLATLQQPPQHLDYLPHADNALPNGLLNVTRDPAFNVVFSRARQTEMSNTTTTTTSWTAGASEQVTAGGTVSNNFLVEKGKLSFEVSEKVQYTHEHSETGTAGVHDTLSVDFSVSPVDDDALNLITQRLQIWRYRLYGAKNEDPDTGTTAPNAYYEVYVPLGATNGWYGGKGVDDYQPVHENGNVLSYPPIGPRTKTYTPPDAGTWQQPAGCAKDPTQEFTTPLTGTVPQTQNLSGITTTLTIRMDHSATCENSHSSTNKVSAEGDLKVSVDLTENAILAKAEQKASAEFTIEGGQSWNTLTTTSNTTSESDTFEIHVGLTIASGWNHTILPVMYFTADGNPQLSFAASALGGSQWGKWYTRPDPALNLPNKYTAPSGTTAWQFATSFDATQVRGFFLRDGRQPDARTGLGPRWGGPVPWGIPLQEGGFPLQIEARVYNYSVGSPIASIPVRFDIADYDATTQTVANRRTLGTVTADYSDEVNHPDGPALGKTFPPLGVGRAVYTLDTAHLPAPRAGTTADYIIYAVLDPEQTIAQTHGWRQANVIIVPYTAGTGNVGTLLTFTVLDDRGNTVTSISTQSTGTVGTDILRLRDAFNNSILGKAPAEGGYGILATEVPTVEPTSLVLSAGGNATLPASTELRATLAFTQLVHGTTALYLLPSVKTLPHQTAGLSATNLAVDQNNEGHGFLSLCSQADATALGCTAQPETDLFLRVDSLGAIDLNGAYQTSHATVLLSQPLPLRVCGHASAPHGASARAGVYWGDPAAGGLGIALKRLTGINGPEGSCAWFTWVPREPGHFTLHAVLDEPADDAQPGNNHVTLGLTVVTP